MMRRGSRSGFTLVELLVVIGIIAILAVAALPAYRMAIQHANYAGCSSRMRSLGVAFTLYANDNSGRFPGRATTSGHDRWPVLLLPYVGQAKNYVDPGDPVANAVSTTDLVSNSANNSSFFFNGFNDMGAYTNENFQAGMANITNASGLILIGQKISSSTQYYMDFVEHNQVDILNKKAYFAGACYTFADGSSRFILQTDYDKISSGRYSDGDKMWLLNQSYEIPPPPAVP